MKKQCPKRGTKEHYFQVVTHMMKLINRISEQHPEAIDDLRDLAMGLQIVNNEYVLKRYPEFKEERKTE